MGQLRFQRFSVKELVTYIEFVLGNNLPVIIQAIDVHACFKIQSVDVNIRI